MLNIRENIPLRNLTTFRIGGPARFFCEVSFANELAETVDWANKNCGGKFFILGGGSNILISDEGFDGLVILMKMKGMEFGGIEGKGGADSSITAVVGAGENWDAFVGESVSRGFFGAENLSGIPGTAGAAPVQNIGAYGVEAASIIAAVRAYDTEKNEWRDFLNAAGKNECNFQYRDSIFKHEKNKRGGARYVITSVTFNLEKFVSAAATPLNLNYKDLEGQNLNTPTDVRKAVLAIRARKLPDVAKIGTAGSFFKNPIISEEHFSGLRKKYPELSSFPVAEKGMVKIPLAWILDHVCGYKGVTKGNVGTYQNQALVIVNNFSGQSGATAAADIKKFADEIAKTVKEKTDIDIEPEVQYVG